MNHVRYGNFNWLLFLHVYNFLRNVPYCDGHNRHYKRSTVIVLQCTRRLKPKTALDGGRGRESLVKTFPGNAKWAPFRAPRRVPWLARGELWCCWGRNPISLERLILRDYVCVSRHDGIVLSLTARKRSFSYGFRWPLIRARWFVVFHVCSWLMPV